MNKLSLNLISLVFGLSCLVAGEAFSASLNDVNACESILARRAFQTDELFVHDKTTEDRSVFVVGHSKAGQHKEYILERKKAGWASMNRPEFAPNAPEGDPRAIAFILGGDLAHFFGISIINDKKMILPDMKSFNEKILILNESLSNLGLKPIPVRFYMTDEALVSDEVYNKNFANDGAFPISADLDFYIHDISFHLGAVALPADFSSQAIKVTAAHSKFIEFLKTKLTSGTEQEKKIYSWSLSLLSEIETELIDQLFGNSVGLYAGTIKNSRSNNVKFENGKVSAKGLTFEFAVIALDSAIKKFFSDKKSPLLQDILRHRFRQMTNKVMFSSANLAPNAYISADDIHTALEKLLDQFIKSNSQIDWTTPLLDFEAASLFYDVKVRVDELNRAMPKRDGQ